MLLIEVKQELDSDLTQSAKKVFKRCLPCHDSERATAKRIPFKNPLSLKDKNLSDAIVRSISPGAEKPMPPGRPLGEKELEEMKKFINQLNP
jgi:hypothetical protein